MIEIISAEKHSDQFAGHYYWACWLELEQDSERWALPATAPGHLLEEELQAHFEAQENVLWQVAQTKQHPSDVTVYLVERELLIRFLNVLLSELNILRDGAGLPPRTLAQLKNALKGQ